MSETLDSIQLTDSDQKLLEDYFGITEVDIKWIKQTYGFRKEAIPRKFFNSLYKVTIAPTNQKHMTNQHCYTFSSAVPYEDEERKGINRKPNYVVIEYNKPAWVPGINLNIIQKQVITLSDKKERIIPEYDDEGNIIKTEDEFKSTHRHVPMYSINVMLHMYKLRKEVEKKPATKKGSGKKT